MFTLPEELVLVGLNEKAGTIVCPYSRSFPYTLSAALLMELLINPEAMKDKMLEEAAGKVKRSPIKNDLKEIIRGLSGGLEEIILDRMIKTDFIRFEERKRFLFFRYRFICLVDAMPRVRVLEHLWDLVLGEEEVDDRDLLMISLIESCGLVDEIFSGEDRGPARERVGELLQASFSGREIYEALTQLQKEPARAGQALALGLSWS